MKKILVALSVLLISCEKKTENVEIKKTSSIINDVEIELYVIDSCEYIGDLNSIDHKRNFLTHKGNCKNTIHYENKH